MNESSKYMQVTVSFKGEPLQTISAKDPWVLIGRSNDCHVVLDNAGVSRNHARIERQEDQIAITDLNSGNGTFVNGKPINKVVLNSSDTLTIGKFAIKVRITDQPHAPVQNPQPAADDIANNSNSTVFLTPQDKQQILSQSRQAAPQAHVYRPQSQTLRKPKSSPWPVFFMGILVGLAVWGFSSLI